MLASTSSSLHNQPTNRLKSDLKFIAPVNIEAAGGWVERERERETFRRAEDIKEQRRRAVSRGVGARKRPGGGEEQGKRRLNRNTPGACNAAGFRRGFSKALWESSSAGPQLVLSATAVASKPRKPRLDDDDDDDCETVCRCRRLRFNETARGDIH